jgi:two-component system OmpR family response regulator
VTENDVLARQGRDVLIIDDDSSGALLVATLLELEGYQAIQPANWDEPLHDLESQYPCLVIIDVRLRGKSGFDLLNQIRNHADPEVAKMPVIMMSAEDHSLQSQRDGANGFLSKPFNVPAMLEIVRNVGGG